MVSFVRQLMFIVEYRQKQVISFVRNDIVGGLFRAGTGSGSLPNCLETAETSQLLAAHIIDQPRVLHPWNMAKVTS